MAGNTAEVRCSNTVIMHINFIGILGFGLLLRNVVFLGNKKIVRRFI